MGEIVSLDNRDVIARYFRKNIPLNIYQIGDLDDFFWSRTKWYALKEDGEIRSIALIYTPSELSALILLADQESYGGAMKLADQLPDRVGNKVYCHFTPGLEEPFKRVFSFDDHRLHHKMYLTAKDKVAAAESRETFELSIKDRADLEQFYAESYPENWFDARMLETGTYFGIRQAGRIVAAGGIHVYSPERDVAALGNIATNPAYRGRGFGSQITAAICKKLLTNVGHIGLNVKADNAVAISCYRKLGFEIVADYREIMLTRKR